MLVEQAIFTSAQTERGDGYQLIAASSGIDDAEARRFDEQWSEFTDRTLANPAGGPQWLGRDPQAILNRQFGAEH